MARGKNRITYKMAFQGKETIKRYRKRIKMEFTKEEQVWSTGTEGVKDALRKKAHYDCNRTAFTIHCFRAGTSQEQTYSEDQR